LTGLFIVISVNPLRPVLTARQPSSKEHPVRSRTIAIAGSIAALSLVAAPVAAVAATTHHPSTAARVNSLRDASGVRHVDRTLDKSSADTSRDTRNG
jgi:hypothetical protein